MINKLLECAAELQLRQDLMAPVLTELVGKVLMNLTPRKFAPGTLCTCTGQTLTAKLTVNPFKTLWTSQGKIRPLSTKSGNLASCFQRPHRAFGSDFLNMYQRFRKENKIINREEGARWQKNKTWRSPSSPQIHQKYIYTWNCSYRTPTEHWQKMSDLPKGKKLPMYLGRVKEKINNRDKRIGMGPAPAGGSCEGGKVSTH